MTDEELFKCCIGQRIHSLTLHQNRITIIFRGGKSFRIYDGAQYCCESRYITSDDDLSSMVGDIFMGVDEVERDFPPLTSFMDEVHEYQAFRIRGYFGEVVFVTHNVHNGYYGGFQVTFNQAPDVDVGGWVPLKSSRFEESLDDLDVLLLRMNFGDA